MGVIWLLCCSASKPACTQLEPNPIFCFFSMGAKVLFIFLSAYLCIMKEILLNYTRYNAWANARIIDLLKNLSDEELDRELGGSFPSVRATAYNIWGAES